MFTVDKESSNDDCAFGALAKLCAARKDFCLTKDVVHESMRLFWCVPSLAEETGPDSKFHALSQLESCGTLAQLFHIMNCSNIPESDQAAFQDVCLRLISTIESEPRIVAAGS